MDRLRMIVLLLVPLILSGQADDSRLEKAFTQRTLEQCLQIALQNNHQLKISDQALKVAEMQYRQVLSSYWPQISVNVQAVRLDQSPYFVYPEETAQYQVSGLNLPGIPLAGPLNMTVTMPEKRTKLMDRTNITSSLDFIYPLYLGGKRPALVRQAKGQIRLLEQSRRQSDLQLIYDIKTRYYANVLAQLLADLGKETLERVQATLDLTENLYKNGSGRVKKTDFLKFKMFEANVRALQARLENNVLLSARALAFTMADSQSAAILARDDSIPYVPSTLPASRFLQQAFQSNPEWQKSEEALKILEARIDEAEADFMFNVALIGQLQHIENKYDAGMVSSPDKDRWMIGLAVQIPLFSGFSSKYQVEERKLQLQKLKEQRLLLKDGLGLQIRNTLSTLQSLQQEIKAAHEAMLTAQENRSLTERAYAIEMADAEEMIQAQLFESLMIAKYHKLRYDYFCAQASLEKLVGQKIEQAIEN